MGTYPRKMLRGCAFAVGLGALTVASPSLRADGLLERIAEADAPKPELILTEPSRDVAPLVLEAVEAAAAPHFSGEDPWQFSPSEAQGRDIRSKVVIVHDYADTFTPRPVNLRGLPIEQRFGNRPAYWGGTPIQFMPHPSGEGTLARLPMRDGVAMIGVPYRMRDDLQVQFSAVQTPGYIAVAIGDLQALGNPEHPSALSVRFRTTGSDIEVGLYNSQIGEVDTGLKSNLGKVGDWHNYAVRFDVDDKALEIFADENFLGTVLLRDVGGEEAVAVDGGEYFEPPGSHAQECEKGGSGGPFAGFPPQVSSVTIGGSGGDTLFVDDVQIGAPFLIPISPRLPSQAQTPDTLGFDAFGSSGIGGGSSPANENSTRTDGPPTEGLPTDGPPTNTPPIPAPAALPAGLLLLGLWAFKRRRPA